MILNLARGSNGFRVPLRLPATPADVGSAYAKLDEIGGDAGKTRIASVVSEVSFLDRYLRDRMTTRPGDYCDLNELAEKIDSMNEQELRTFDGALNAESINGIEDILQVADSLKNYIFVSGVTTEKELGRFLVDSGYKGFPESVKPYLDYTAIGTEYYAERGGAFTGSGYTLRRSSAEPLVAEQKEAPHFRMGMQMGY